MRVTLELDSRDKYQKELVKLLEAGTNGGGLTMTLGPIAFTAAPLDVRVAKWGNDYKIIKAVLKTVE